MCEQVHYGKMDHVLINQLSVKTSNGTVSLSLDDKARERAKVEKAGRILIIFPTPVRKQTMLNCLPPLGILNLASFLESQGLPADVIDCHVTTHMPDFNNYDSVCFSVNIANVQNTADYIKEIRANGGKQKILIGGPQNPTRGEHWINQYNVDAVFIGEAEHSMYEYLTSEDPTSVKGIILKKDGKPFYTGNRPVFMNVDALPFPALDKVPIRMYNTTMKKGFPVSSIVTSRGCPAKCTFCYDREGVWRQRSVKNVVDEIEWQVNTLGVRELWIADDNFTLNRQRTWDICEEIIRRGIKVNMQCKNGIRADKVDKELLTKMKEAGVWLVAVAPESGQQASLDRMRKGFTLETVKQAVKWCKEIDMKTFALYIFGLPWETMDDMKKTFAFSKELDTDFVQYSRYTPMEGTPLYEEVKAEGMLLKNEFLDMGIHSGTVNYLPKNVSREEMTKLYKQVYRGYYLRPRKMWNILRTLTLRDIYYTAKYALASSSM